MYLPLIFFKCMLQEMHGQETELASKRKNYLNSSVSGCTILYQYIFNLTGIDQNLLQDLKQLNIG